MRGLLELEIEFEDIGTGNSKLRSQIDEIRDLTESSNLKEVGNWSRRLRPSTRRVANEAKRQEARKTKLQAIIKER